jgi:hypothetical protein
VKDRSHRMRLPRTMSHSKRNDVLRMGVHHTVHFWEPSQYLAVYVALAVALWCVGVDRRRVLDPVRYEVAHVLDERRGAGIVGGDDVLLFVERVSHGYVAEGVDEAMVVEDVVCANEQTQLLLELRWNGHL